MSGNRGYRDTVTIQQNSAADGAATPDYTGAAFMSAVPCQITSRGGNESYRGRVLEAHLTHIVESQWIDGVLPSMRLYVTGGIHTGRYLNIAYAQPVEGNGRARKLELQCMSQEVA